MTAWLADRRVRRGLIAVGLLVVAWFVVVVVLVVLGIRSADDGYDQLRAEADRIGLGELASSDGSLLDDPARTFDRADALLSNPLVAPAELLPVVGRQIRSASALAGAADELLAAGRRSMAVVQDRLDTDLSTGPARLELLRTLDGELSSLATALDDARLGPDDALIGPLRDIRDEADERVTRLRSDLGDARAIVATLEQLLAGPRSYLVLAANNAEMRIGSGMFLSVGRIEFAGGEMVVHEFDHVAGLTLPESVAVPPEIQHLWGFGNPGKEWRNLALTPRFPVNAAMARDMWAALGRPPVDGVLMVDSFALSQLLRVSGAVSVEGFDIDADNAIQVLMHDQYVGIRPGDVNEERREQLAGVARAVVDRFGQGPIDVAVLVDALREAQRHRGLMAWDADPVRQAGWVAAGVDGDLDDRSLAVGVANAGGSKLDQYVYLTGTIAGAAAEGDRVGVTLDLRVANRTPGDDLPRYVVGMTDDRQYRGIVAANLPGSAADVEVSGDGRLITTGPDGPTRAVGVVVDVPRSEIRTVTVRFTLPADVAGALSLVPGARIPATQWQLPDGAFAEPDRETLDLDVP